MARAAYIVDAFADRPFAGNAAGVVTDCTGLTAAQMQAIARELSQSETCFVGPAPNADADFHLRWFTPTVEVDLCGHATVGAYICLADEQRLPLSTGSCHLRHLTQRGILDVWVSATEGATPTVMMSVGVPKLRPAPDDRSEAAAVIGLAPEDVDSALPLAVEDRGARLLVPVRSLQRLLALVPNQAEMIKYGVRTGYHRFTLICRETRDSASVFHIRHFAPANGIPEDPVTGTAHAVGAAFLAQQGLLPPGMGISLTGEQGDSVGRPGHVTIEMIRQDQTIVDVRVGGTGRIVARGTITES